MSDWIDLTKPLDASTRAYREGDYRDPEFRATPWCSHAGRGFQVSRLELGTQTGTHIDAPRHFDPSGATIDSWLPEDCIGRYLLVRPEDTDQCAEVDWSELTALIIDARASAPMTPSTVESVADCPSRLIVVIGDVTIDHRDPLFFHRLLAKKGKFLLEDTRCDVGPIPRRGQIVAVPLPLVGLSGSPARALVNGVGD